MGNLGFMVMINKLSGNSSSVRAFQNAIGKQISSLELTENELLFVFSDGARMRLFDNGQSCCETRYMTTDDDLSYYVGSKLLGAEIRDAPTGDEKDYDHDDHDVQFLLVNTDKGTFTMENHNVHNGYYGGFSVCAADDMKGDDF